MKLETIIAGEEGAPPLLVAHGLFGSARNWGAIQKRLSDGFRVTAVDMRNHGASPWDDEHDYVSMSDDLAETLDRPSFVLGHSMGGKAAMALALRHPETVRGLIVADIAPVSYDHTQLHLIEAMRSVDLSRIESRRDADRQLAARVETPGIRAFLLQSLDVAERRWKLNLDVLARDMDRIVGWPDLRGRFDGPTLFLTGAQSDYVEAAHRPVILERFPRTRFASLKGAGHWLHADRPREVVDTVRGFVNAIVGERRSA